MKRLSNDDWIFFKYAYVRVETYHYEFQVDTECISEQEYFQRKLTGEA